MQQENLGLLAQVPPSQGPSASDRSNFASFHKYMMENVGVDIPEAELRQMYEVNQDGSVGRRRTGAAITHAIILGEEKFTGLPSIPILSIYTIPRSHGTQLDRLAPILRTELEDRETVLNQKQADAFKAGVPSANVVILPNANHVVFLSNEDGVLCEMISFINHLQTDAAAH
jgi:non-heme chloroperoxidase